MTAKLYVGNLPYETSQAELQTMFEQFGSVKSVRVITDPYTGKGKGFGFVEMTTSEEAQAAIEQLNGQETFGRTLRVNEARDNKEGGAPRGEGRFGGGNGGGGAGGGRRFSRGGGGGGGDRGGNSFGGNRSGGNRRWE